MYVYMYVYVYVYVYVYMYMSVYVCVVIFCNLKPCHMLTAGETQRLVLPRWEGGLAVAENGWKIVGTSSEHPSY